VHRRLTYALLVAVGFAALGCAQGPRKLPKHIRDARGNSTAELYEVIEGGLGALEDGYTFRDTRFRFEFDHAFDQVAGYETQAARHDRGVEASEILNGGYEFVGELFGLAANKELRVVIAPTLRGSSSDAYTATSWQESGTRRAMVEGSENSVIYFAKESFEDRTVLAHEMTHALLGAYRLPAWFAEGIATLVEVDYGKSKRIDLAKFTIAPIGLDDRGYNVIQTWRGHESGLPERSLETYGSAYAIVREISRRYGAHVYPLFFQELLRTKAHLSGTGLSLATIVDTLNDVTGADVAPFFEEIAFDVSSL